MGLLRATTIFPVLVTVALFMNLPSYLFSLDDASTTPAIYVQLLAGLGLCSFLFRPAELTRLVMSPVVLWIVFYLSLSAVYLFASDGDPIATRVFKDRLRDCVVLWLAFSTFARSERALRIGVRCTIVCTLIGSSLNLVDFLWPGTVIPVWHEVYNPGRGAALYLNPNSAGSALLFGLIIGLFHLPVRLRALFLSLVGIGVLVTFSRAAILFLAFLLLIEVPLKRIIPTRQYIGIIGIICTLGVFVSVVEIVSTVSAGRGLNETNINQRIEWFLSGGKERDRSGEERLAVAEAAWRSFEDAPLFGQGLAERAFLLSGSGSHNMYLQHLAQHGLLGLLIYIPLVLIVCNGLPGFLRSSSLGLLLFMALFSHNQLDSYPALFTFGLLGAYSFRQRHGATERLTESA